jgi:hypothetical protein
MRLSNATDPKIRPAANQILIRKMREPRYRNSADSKAADSILELERPSVDHVGTAIPLPRRELT